MLRLLGPLDLVDRNGDSHPIPGRRAQCLLALLALADGRTVSSDALIEAVWADRLPNRPAAALQTQVFRLRKLLQFPGAPQIHTATSGYSMEASDGPSDAVRLEQLLACAANAPPAEAVRLLEEALSLWRGVPFIGMEDVDELRGEQQRLVELHAQTIEQHAGALANSGRAHLALARLEPFVASNPIRPQGTAILMRAYIHCGREGDAMRVFERHRRELVEQLGIDPSPEVRALERTLFEGGSRRSDGATTSDGSAQTPFAPFDQLSIHRVSVAGTAPLGWGEIGNGPPVVVPPAWVSHLSVIAAGRDPRSALLAQLANKHRVITYDRRGTGLSPGEVDDFGLAAAVDELAAVVDCIGEPVDLVGISGGGPIAIAYAAQHPARVKHLALFGTYANGPKTLGELGSPLLELLERRPRLAYEWLAELYRPGASAAATQALVTVLHESAPLHVVTGYLRAIFETDVSRAAARLSIPTVILHYRRDRVMPFAGGEDLSTLVPGARFIPMDGRWHAPDTRDVAAIVRIIDALFADDPLSLRADLG